MPPPLTSEPSNPHVGTARSHLARMTIEDKQSQQQDLLVRTALPPAHTRKTIARHANSAIELRDAITYDYPKKSTESTD